MNSEDAHLAAKILVEYRQFLEKKGYVFDGEIAIDRFFEGSTSNLHCELSLDKHVVKITNPLWLLHEMTHIILKKDGIEPMKYEVGGSALEVIPKNILEIYGNVLVSGVTDHYVDVLMLKFLGETDSEALRGWVTGYFKEEGKHFKRHFNKHLPDSAKELMDPNVVGALSVFNYFIISLSLFFSYGDYRRKGGKPDDFDSIVKKLEKEYHYLSPFLSNRYALIKNFVDNLPSYNELKKACGDSQSPLPTAKLSIRLFNILYYGVDMDDKSDVLEFARLVRNGKTDALSKLLRDYGVSFEKSELKDAHKLVEKMIDKDYGAFIKRCDGEKTVFSPLLI